MDQPDTPSCHSSGPPPGTGLTVSPSPPGPPGHFDIECTLLANGSNKIKIRVLWIVFRHLISCALCVFWKKAQQNQNLDSVLFAFFRKQHEFKRSHFDIECPLLANGSYKIKIRVLWIVFRHLISVVRCACFEKKHSKTKISILCCLRFLELADWSYKIKIRILWIVFRCLQWSYYQLCVVCVLIKLQFINKFLQAINQSQKNISTFYMAVLALKHILHIPKHEKSLATQRVPQSGSMMALFIL